MSYIFFVPPYNEHSGGTKVLYFTAAEMLKQGAKVRLWQNGRPVIYDYFKIKKWVSILRWFLKLKFQYKDPPFDLKYGEHKDLEDSNIIYYCLVDGNPLRAKKVIRWIMYFPFRLYGKVDYGKNEKFYTFLSEYTRNTKWEHRSKLFNITFPIRDEYLKYKDLNDWSSRTNTCFMYRKSKKDKKFNYLDNDFTPPSNSICIDGLSHDQIAQIFSKSKYFYCYDLYTGYQRDAATCGCIPIVIPPKNLSIEDWYNDPRERYGIAFGEDNIKWAIRTRSLMLDYISEKVNKSKIRITEFIKENE
jgi:hypothetical protein